MLIGTHNKAGQSTLKTQIEARATSHLGTTGIWLQGSPLENIILNRLSLSRKMPPIPYLEDIPTTDSIFGDSDQDENFHFPTELSFRGISSRSILTDRQTLALALTEFCCRNGRGKVRFDAVR